METVPNESIRQKMHNTRYKLIDLIPNMKIWKQFSQFCSIKYYANFDELIMDNIEMWKWCKKGLIKVWLPFEPNGNNGMLLKLTMWFRDGIRSDFISLFIDDWLVMIVWSSNATDDDDDGN